MPTRHLNQSPQEQVVLLSYRTTYEATCPFTHLYLQFFSFLLIFLATNPLLYCSF